MRPDYRVEKKGEEKVLEAQRKIVPDDAQYSSYIVEIEKKALPNKAQQYNRDRKKSSP